MHVKNIAWLAVFVMLWLTGCSEPAGEAEEAAAPAAPNLVLHFQESEPGIEPYAVRMLITPNYLRVDDGFDEGGFVLYDRGSRNIYSVTHEDRQILRIDYRPVDIEPPRELVYTVNESSDPEAPTIDGKPPVHYELLTNGEICHDVVAVSGLLEGARTALIEYHDALAGEQAANLSKTPVEYQSDCMLSNLVFAPARYLEFGFPIQERSHDGYMRALVDYERGVELAPELFLLPEGYREYSINPLDDEASSSLQQVSEEPASSRVL